MIYTLIRLIGDPVEHVAIKHAVPPKLSAHDHALLTRWQRTFSETGELTARVELRGEIDNPRREVQLRQLAPVGLVAEETLDVSDLSGWEMAQLSAPLHPMTETIELRVISAGQALETRQWTLSIAGAPVESLAQDRATTPAGPRDLSTGSGVTLRALDDDAARRLATLGRVWAFLKYHHPTILSGAVDWDGELLDALVADERGRDVLADWRVRFAAVPCEPCITPHADSLGPVTFPWLTALEPVDAAWLQEVHRTRGSLQDSVFDTEPYRFTVESRYSERHPIHDAGLRLLTLFRVYGVMEHLFTYGHLSPGWQEQLPTDVRRFLATPSDAVAWEQLLHEHAGRFHDGHVSFYNNFDSVPPVGACRLPVVLEYVSGMPMVVSSELKAVRLGDVLEAVDGRVVADMESEWLRYHPGATLAGRRSSLAQRLTSGPCGPVTATFFRGKRRVDVVGERGRHPDAVVPHARPGGALEVDRRVATLVMSKFKPSELPALMQRVVDEADALIIDVRDYPAFVWTELPGYFQREPSFTHRGALEDPNQVGGLYWNAEGRVAREPRSPHFAGPVAVLADGGSFSLGEGTVLTLKSVPRVKVFGDTTSGTNGSQRKVPVPGTFDLGFTVNRVYSLNETLAQGVGIPPDVYAVPTRRDVRKGRDVAYEAAQSWVRSQL